MEFWEHINNLKCMGKHWQRRGRTFGGKWVMSYVGERCTSVPPTPLLCYSVKPLPSHLTWSQKLPDRRGSLDCSKPRPFIRPILLESRVAARKGEVEFRCVLSPSAKKEDRHFLQACLFCTAIWISRHKAESTNFLLSVPVPSAEASLGNSWWRKEWRVAQSHSEWKTVCPKCSWFE